jgi:hypothetical protein
MSASMTQTFISPNFLTKFLEEYCAFPVLWQVRSVDYSNSAKRDEAWDLLVQFTREKIPVLFQDEARQGKITQMLHECEQTSDMVLQPPFPKRKKTSSKTSRIVDAEEAHSQTLIEKAMAVFSQQDDEYGILGKTYAGKLRRMPTAQRDIADKLINGILFKGLQSHLTSSTFISDCGYTSGAWLSSDTPYPVSTYSNPIPSATSGPLHSPE